MLEHMTSKNKSKFIRLAFIEFPIAFIIGSSFVILLRVIVGSRINYTSVLFAIIGLALFLIIEIFHFYYKLSKPDDNGVGSGSSHDWRGGGGGGSRGGGRAGGGSGHDN